MLLDLVKDFQASEFNRTTIKEAIERNIGRKINPKKETILLDWREHEQKGTDYMIRYGAVIFEGDVYGFLEVDYTAEKLRFVPSSLLLPV